MFDDSRTLGFLAYHEASDVVQEYYGGISVVQALVGMSSTAEGGRHLLLIA